MSIADISLLTALFAGAFSFLSPCVLPLVPPYLCYMAGISVEQFRDERFEAKPQVRKAVLLAALFFTLGFATVFVALGAGASTIGMVLRQNLDILAKIGGLIIIVWSLPIWRVSIRRMSTRPSCVFPSPHRSSSSATRFRW